MQPGFHCFAELFQLAFVAGMQKNTDCCVSISEGR